MNELTKKQAILINDFKDDIEFYKEELDSEIKTHKMLLFTAIGVAIVIGILLTVFPELLVSLKELSEHLGVLAALGTETIPLTFASKSFNKGNTVRKKKKGLRIFQKDINRMEQGILPNDKDSILKLEQELMRYINT